MVYKLIQEFKKKYPATIAWRIKKHSKVIETHLNPGETVLYAFAAQKNASLTQMFHTFAIVITNKRILLAQKRVVFGYLFYSITPDLFNDLKVTAGLIWGKVIIDTVKEKIILSNIDKKALDEIETNISENMMKQKKEYSK